MKQANQQKGFTIIEVVLVLAIAGLIFLVVFLAVPALQRSQRDNQRRNDASRVSTALTNYQSNNQGKLPDNNAFNGFVVNYLKNNDNDGGKDEGELRSPSTKKTYRLNRVTANNDFTGISGDIENLQVAIGFKCDGEGLTADSGKFAVRAKLEGGGIYCVGSN